MKKIISCVLVCVLLLGSVFALASCAKKVPSGTYEAELELFGQNVRAAYSFSGNKVEAEVKITVLGKVTTESAEGKYEITENGDGSMEITFEFEEENDYFENHTLTYKEGDGFIELGGVKYTKVDK